MDLRLKEHISPKKFVILLAALFLLFGLAVIFISDIFVAPFAAFYALVLWFAKDTKLLSAVLPLPILAISFFAGIGVILSVCVALCCGLLLWFMYRSRCTKFDTALAITAVFTLFLFVAFFLAACAITKEYTFASFISFYEDFIEAQRVAFADAFSDLHVVNENGEKMYMFTEEAINAMFLSVARMTFSLLVLFAFLFCGVTCKIFSFVVARAEKDEGRIRAWRFLPTNVIVYFYLICYIVSIFVASRESLFSVVVQNLSYIFMFVFFYMGLQHLLFVFSSKRKGMLILVLFFLLFVLNASGILILSFFGAYATIGVNRTQNKQ
jgi:hypothetical protein